MIIFPIIPSAIAFFAFHHWSADVVCDPTWTTRLVSRVVSTSFLISSSVWHIGFSR
jgi:hypothetical protein